MFFGLPLDVNLKSQKIKKKVAGISNYCPTKLSKKVLIKNVHL